MEPFKLSQVSVGFDGFAASIARAHPSFVLPVVCAQLPTLASGILAQGSRLFSHPSQRGTGFVGHGALCLLGQSCKLVIITIIIIALSPSLSLSNNNTRRWASSAAITTTARLQLQFDSTQQESGFIFF